MFPPRILLPLLLLLPSAHAGAPAAEPPRFTPELEDFVRNFKPGGQDFAGQARVLPPEESVRRMQVPDGYAAELVASEPAVRQPIDLRFDARGPVASALLTYGQSSDPASPHATDQMRAFADKRWPVLPFHAEDVARARVGEVLRITRP